jgi:hypothetical protein
MSHRIRGAAAFRKDGSIAFYPQSAARPPFAFPWRGPHARPCSRIRAHDHPQRISYGWTADVSW